MRDHFPVCTVHSNIRRPYVRGHMIIRAHGTGVYCHVIPCNIGIIPNLKAYCKKIVGIVAKNILMC